MTTASITLPVPHRSASYGIVTQRVPLMRRLVLTAGLALVTWARRPATPLTHEQQALRLAAQAATSQQRDGAARYGIAQ